MDQKEETELRMRHGAHWYYNHETLDERIDRVREHVDFGASDIGYFLGVPAFIVSERWLKKGRRGRKRVIPVGRDGRQLSYRLASMIYKTKEDGKSGQHIQEELGIKRVVLEQALDLRSSLEPRMIEILQCLYPERKIDKPYL